MATTHDPRTLITDFARDNSDVSALQFIINDPEGVEIKLFEGGGMVNYVYRVQSQDHSSSVVLKYAEEQFRVLPEEKVPLERQTLEYNCLVLMHQIQPGSVPEPYCLDTKHNVLAMQDMNGWQMLGDQLERPKRHVDLNAPTNLGRLLSKVHRQTRQASVSAEVWQQYQHKFKQVELKEIMRNYAYVRGFIETDPINRIPVESTSAYRDCVHDVRTLGFETKLNQIWARDTCFVHADCHFKSIFVKDEQVSLFDFEFAFLGHPAINLSWLICCYVTLLVVDAELTTDPDANPSVSLYRSQCLQACRNLLEAYLEDDVVGSTDVFLSELALFTGSMLFFFSVFDGLEIIMIITDVARRICLKAGHHIMLKHADIKTLDDYMQAISI